MSYLRLAFNNSEWFWVILDWHSITLNSLRMAFIILSNLGLMLCDPRSSGIDIQWSRVIWDWGWTFLSKTLPCLSSCLLKCVCSCLSISCIRCCRFSVDRQPLPNFSMHYRSNHTILFVMAHLIQNLVCNIQIAMHYDYLNQMQLCTCDVKFKVKVKHAVFL